MTKLRASGLIIVMRKLILVLLLAVPAIVSAQTESAETWLSRAATAVGFERAGDRVIHDHTIFSDQQNYQSERYYPPFFDAMITAENWFSPRSGVLRTSSQMTFPGGGGQPSIEVYDSHGGVRMRGDRAVPVPRSQLRKRNLNAWAVIYDWMHSANVRVLGTEKYRDYPRVVLERTNDGGEQRLFLDPKSGLPVKLDYAEPHYLWDQRHIEYVYSLWIMQGDILVNSAAFRLADGAVEISATTGDTELVAANSVKALEMPTGVPSAPELPLFLEPRQPETVQVSPTTYLLSNPGYTEAITLVGDEVFIFDATQGEQRAAADAALIARLFPGHHKINLVVTDLAWPHIAGLRYWVAQGATVIAHSAARPFLEEIVNRRWTFHPDALEQHRNKVKFNFLGVDAPAQFASGRVSVAPIDGIGSETALMAFVPSDGFLWASDYIQTITERSEYAKEVCDAVKRTGWQPRQAAAEHMALFKWEVIQKLMSGPVS